MNFFPSFFTFVFTCFIRLSIVVIKRRYVYVKKPVLRMKTILLWFHFFLSLSLSHPSLSFSIPHSFSLPHSLYLSNFLSLSSLSLLAIFHPLPLPLRYFFSLPLFFSFSFFPSLSLPFLYFPSLSWFSIQFFTDSSEKGHLITAKKLFHLSITERNKGRLCLAKKNIKVQKCRWLKFCK
jgi:hypothetical protein